MGWRSLKEGGKSRCGGDNRIELNGELVKEEGGIVAAPVLRLRVVRMVKLRGHVAEREERGKVVKKKKMKMLLIIIMNDGGGSYVSGGGGE
ncbi:hypothetical protein TSUD_39170 [Trifolium subterraneum]|uniref:Uncharacterized protein n=1 Tax=Trifolium subterraneum TaxID=3900 RepID=A0A2Z6MLS0_TRISU|nr:hypothetical protein TSUD_39170 [Trifolium subterraneum]